MLVPRFILGDIDLTDYPYAIEWRGTDYGSPQNVYQVVESLAADGDSVISPRSSNRTLSLTVIIEGPDLLTLATAERALLLECEKAQNLLTIDPGDGFAEVGIYQTFRAQVTHVPNEDMEIANLRRYTLTFQAKPFVRAVDPVTVSLTYGSDSGTSLDSGGSTTGWSSAAGTLSAVTVNTETAVKLTLPAPIAATSPSVDLTRAALALTAAKSYLAIDVAAEPASSPGAAGNWMSGVRVRLGTTYLASPVAAVPQSTGFIRFFFVHTAAGTTKDVVITLSASAKLLVSAFYVGGIYAYSSAPGSGLLIADVEGSERAPVTVKVGRVANSALGATFIYSDPTMLEFGWNPGDPTTWPLAPAGSYMVVIPSPGLSDHFSTLTLNGQASSTRGGMGTTRAYDYALGDRRDGLLGTITTGWSDQLLDTGTAETLPATRYLFRDEPGVTSLLYYSSVTGRYLFVDSATIERYAAGWSGSASDGSNAVSMTPYMEIPGSLVITPPRFALWIKSSSDITVSATYYPLSHTFVPPKGLTS